MARYMEEHLDMPLREVLSIMQDRIMNQTTYFGVRALQSPTDYWVYQEIIFETRPDVIIEIGNASGGSALALAHICDLLDHGRLIGLDLSHAGIPERVKRHPRITLIEGDACESFGQVARLISGDERVLVIEDSSHTYENTLNVLRRYSGLVKKGDYFIVEDGICHHGLPIGPKPGPFEAVETFVNENSEFELDRKQRVFSHNLESQGLSQADRSCHWVSIAGRGPGSSVARRVTRSSIREFLRLFVPPIVERLVRKLRP